jgi:hypothetical protein
MSKCCICPSQESHILARDAPADSTSPPAPNELGDDFPVASAPKEGVSAPLLANASSTVRMPGPSLHKLQQRCDERHLTSERETR